MTQHQRPPLFELFTRLRKAGIPLGINEYKLMLTALEGGFGMADLEALSNLCKTLWIRSETDRRTFERIFQEITQPEKKSLFPGEGPPIGQPQPEPRPVSGPLPEPGDTLADTTPESEPGDVQAILHMEAGELASKRFERSDEYFPITRRQMKQSWRHLRHPTRQGLPTELDIEKTIDEIGRQGLLLEPIFQPHYINRAEILLLIDRGGSMVPFHLLADRLSETAQHEGRLTNIGVYYFRNYPAGQLFRTHSLQGETPIKDVLAGLHYDRSSVLIFSDGGAARGHFSGRRVEGTRTFLKQLTEHVRYQAWLNPMPRERWTDSTAQSIQQLIPMFDINHRGLERAINVLRGRSTV